MWHYPGQPSRDISEYARRKELNPKIWISGGVYYGTKYRAYAEKPHGTEGQRGDVRLRKSIIDEILLIK